MRPEPESDAPSVMARTFAEHVAACDLDEFESQAVFRALLDALARPGTPVRLPVEVSVRFPPVLAPVLALADVDVTVAVLEHPVDDDRATGHPRWTSVVAAATGAAVAGVDAAAMVVAVAPPTPQVLRRLVRGGSFDPERGTRLSIACRTIAVADGSERHTGSPVTVAVAGPGVDGTATFVVVGIDPSVIETIAEVNSGFPAGVDTWFIADDGTIVGVPRSSTIRITGGR